MTLHLKDRVIEQKLNELSNGEFSKILNKEADTKNGDCLCFTIDKKEDIELSVYIRPEAIEPEYNPHDWNEFPKVKPPYNVMMRVETYTGQGYKLFYNHLGDGDFWCDPNYLLMPKAFSDDVTRFRPWNED